MGSAIFCGGQKAILQVWFWKERCGYCLAKTMLPTTQPGKRPRCLLKVGMHPPSKEAGLTTWPPLGILRLFSVKIR